MGWRHRRFAATMHWVIIAGGHECHRRLYGNRKLHCCGGAPGPETAGGLHMSSEILTATAAVLLVAILPSILWKKFRTVLYETLKHPFRKTEIRFDEKGKVLEVKVSDNL